MKLIAVNGSPRKNWNTGTLLDHALKGAASKGAETELVNLYGLSYTGCISCFACKKKGGASYGRCAVRDGIAPVLDRVLEADALLLGSPIYYSEVTGQMRSFMERLIFPYMVYAMPPRTVFPRKIKVGMIYSGNIPEEQYPRYKHLEYTEQVLGRVFGQVETMFSFDTLQFEDYSKVVCEMFDENKKLQRRAEVFPQDCRKACELGERLVAR